MRRRFRVKEFGRPISLRQTLSYLDSQGWKTRSDRGVIACEGPADDAGKPIIAFVPNDETCPDYPLRLEDLIFVLSTLEERPATEIAHEMANESESAADVHRSQRDDLIHILQQHVRGEASASVIEGLAKELRVLAENVELPSVGNVYVPGVALFLAGCARILSPANEPKLLLWRLCEWAGVRLRIPSPATLDKLHELALTDNPESPDTLLEWLWNHTLDGADDQPAQEAESFSSKEAES